MARLQPMPPVALPTAEIAEFGRFWDAAKAALPKAKGEEVGRICDRAVGKALAVMLGVKVAKPNARSLLPPEKDCVEVGPARVIGGIRPQNFDVAYRPDGVRFAYDSKTLNSRDSIGQNYQNMLNDLGAEASTVHLRFPTALVAFIMAVPEACLGTHRENLTTALMRLSGRISATGDMHKAEAISLVVWRPADGSIDMTWPPVGSRLRIEKFSEQVTAAYYERYAGMPPHNSGKDPVDPPSDL